MRRPYAITNGGAAFALAGFVANWRTTPQPGTEGYYWTSTYRSNNSMMLLYLYRVASSGQEGASPGSSGQRSLGNSIRCVLK